MKKLLLIALLVLGASKAHATNCALASGASTATVQAALTALSSGACTGTANGTTITFASGGAWTITSQLSIPCPSGAAVITGPALASYPGPGPFTGTGPYLATLTSSITNNSAFALPSACTTAITLQNFNYNGGQPSGGGGGMLYGPTGGGSNVTVNNVYMHGNWASTTTAHAYDSLIFLDGTPTGGGNFWNNVTITNSSFGAATDCNPIMTLFTYQGGPFSSAGGWCAAIGVHTSTSNLLVEHNAIYHQEQGMKFFQGASPFPTNAYRATNDTVNFNDFSNIHRIGLEAQQDTNVLTVSFNSFHDQFDPGYGSFGWSFAAYPTQNSNSNVMAANISPQAGGGTTGYLPAAIEFWGNGTGNNNLMQNWTIHTTAGGCSGACGAGYLYGPTYPGGGKATFNNNTFQFPNAWNYFVAEDGGQPPNLSGNVMTTVISSIVSFAPSISPASGAYTFPFTVTLTDPGYSSGAQPLGNTSIYYTIDGTTPVPGSGTTKLYTAPFTVSVAPATIKAVGMWGSYNQPTTYPSGYGFVRSGVVTAGYTSLSGPTLVSIAVTGTSPINVGATDQFTATGTYSDSSTANLTSVASWLSSATGVATVNTSGLGTGISAGSATITATVNAVTSPGFSLTVTGGAPSTIFFVSATPGVGTIGSSSGLFTAVSSGTTNVSASIGSVVSNVLVMTVAGSQPTVLKNVTIAGTTQVK